MSQESLASKMSTLFNKLKTAYIRGDIAYPRVANDYIRLDHLKFYEYPHPHLETFDDNSMPLKEDIYVLSKETLPLWLTHKNIATPATLIDSFIFIDKFIDDGFILRSNAHEIEVALSEIMERLREDAVIVYTGDVADGLIRDRGDVSPMVMEDDELLSILSSDGEIQKSYKINITPYSINLSPFEVENEKETDIDENKENADDVYPKETRRKTFKILEDPLANYPSSLTGKSIKVSNIEELLQLEKSIEPYKNIKNTIEDAKMKKDKKNTPIGSGTTAPAR